MSKNLPLVYAPYKNRATAGKNLYGNKRAAERKVEGLIWFLLGYLEEMKDNSLIAAIEAARARGSDTDEIIALVREHDKINPIGYAEGYCDGEESERQRCIDVAEKAMLESGYTDRKVLEALEKQE